MDSEAVGSRRLTWLRGWFDVHMREILRGALTAFSLKVVAAGLSLLVNIVIARLLGASDAGIYFLAFTIITIAATIGRFGLDNTLVRFIAGSIAAGNWRAVDESYRRSMALGATVSTILGVLLWLFAPWLAQTVFSQPALAEPVRWMACAVPLLSLGALHAQSLQGLKRIRDAVLVLSVLTPLGSLLLLPVTVPVFGVLGAVGALIAAAAIGLWVGRWRWRRWTSASVGQEGPGLKRHELLDSCLPLLGIAVLNLVITWSAGLIIGANLESRDVAIYNAAHRTAMLTSFILLAVNSISAPKFAALYKSGDLVALGRVARHAARLAVLVATPVLAVFLFAPGYVMGLYGPEFTVGATVLGILAAGQFVNVITGSVGHLLIMSGHERIMRNNLLVCAVISLVLSFTLVPLLGLIGGAIANGVIVAAQNLIATYWVGQKLQIRILPLPRLSGLL